MKLAACYTVFNGIELLSDAIESIESEVDEIIISYQLVSNYGNLSDEFLYWKEQNPQYTYIEFNPNLNVDAKSNEKRKHQGLIEKARELRCTHFFLSATDHLYVKEEIQHAKNVVNKGGFKTTYTRMRTYFKSNNLCLTNQLACIILPSSLTISVRELLSKMAITVLFFRRFRASALNLNIKTNGDRESFLSPFLIFDEDRAVING